MDTPVKTILAHINNLKDEEKRLQAENAAMDEELSAIREAEATVSAELMDKRTREKKIEKIRDMFSPTEAEVIYTGENLIIR